MMISKLPTTGSYLSIFERRAALVFDWVTHRLDPPGEVPLTRVHLRLRLSRAYCDRTLKRMIPFEVPHTPFVTERRYCGPKRQCLCPASSLRGAARVRAPATGRHGRRSRRVRVHCYRRVDGQPGFASARHSPAFISYFGRPQSIFNILSIPETRIGPQLRPKCGAPGHQRSASTHPANEALMPPHEKFLGASPQVIDQWSSK